MLNFVLKRVYIRDGKLDMINSSKMSVFF